MTAVPRSHRYGRWLVGVVILGALSWAALSLARGDENESVTALPTPKRELLVYAKPSGSPPFGGPEVIYRSTPTGQDPVRLVPGNDPALSPDGRWVAFWRSRPGSSGRLFVISSRGGQPRALAADASDAIVWSWDSQFIASESLGRVTIVHAPSGPVRTFKVPQGSGNYTFSPDGKTLAFSHSTGSGTNILSITLPDGRIRALTSDDRSYAPLWGPRGIAFERFGINGKGDRCGNCHGDVWLMNADGSNTHQLTHTHAGIYPAAWSANGDHILAAYPASHNGKLYAVDVTTGDARALTGFVGDLFAQGLSRNGNTVLAAIGCGGMATPYGLIETIPFAGGQPSVIVRGPCRATWTA
jgi:Tol biopolymer transport system component